jgi:hypothetical protein
VSSRSCVVGRATPPRVFFSSIHVRIRTGASASASDTPAAAVAAVRVLATGLPACVGLSGGGVDGTVDGESCRVEYPSTGSYRPQAEYSSTVANERKLSTRVPLTPCTGCAAHRGWRVPFGECLGVFVVLRQADECLELAEAHSTAVACGGGRSPQVL